MSRVVCHQSTSLDGFSAGPEQTLDTPMGTGDVRRLHQWMFRADEPGHEADAAWRAGLLGPIGAVVMGRNMFGPVRGAWPDESWRGWWGEEPPYHAPVFVLTHHERAPLETTGTTFHFVTEGFDAAFARAREAAGDGDVRIAGGASTVRQALERDLVDDLFLDVSPFLLGAGERLFDGLTGFTLTPVEVVHSPLATHVHYSR
ncbi:dihydrofolate reductase family protein [Kineococcus rhizosphaerae]|uniref:RibD domain-containing protein n=1 Tax=Kineococcus rhizosphaerae TaxID=559628 RepID=A0A2T0R6G5_9ACTN|nr:dihydrofolate reductase family protein [Kineococcus rhizosphaerae]PRY16748.1 RibD domain-containing protein [Kineococcus rhizosphaerae]